MNYRGEEKIKIGDYQLTLIMEYDRIEKIEEAIGLGIIQISGLIATSRASLKMMSTILHHASGGQVPIKELGDAILQDGVDQLGPKLVMFMRLAFSGGREEVAEGPSLEKEAEHPQPISQ